jgi:hypothetical protein
MIRTPMTQIYYREKLYTRKNFKEWLDLNIDKLKELEKDMIIKAAASAYEDMFGTDGTEYGQKYYEKLTQDDK